MKPVEIAFFGSSLVSAYWNGAATYYRGLVRALAACGHRLTFYEPDAYERQRHRDMADPDWARVVVYPAEDAAWRRAIDEAKRADVVVKASGVGVFDAELEQAVAELAAPSRIVAFWDVDAPATLARVEADPSDPFRRHVPRYDFVFTYGGGRRVCERYARLGARACVPIYNAIDPDMHRPAEPVSEFEGDCGFLGNRLPDREARVERFFFAAADTLPAARFVLGGAGWDDKPRPPNVRWVGHVYTRDHNAFNSSLRAVLNVSRDSMAENGWSPATRVFEAAGAGACLITDRWQGLEEFFEPGVEVLAADDGDEVAAHLLALGRDEARRIGEAARRRVLAEHTYAVRARLVEAALDGREAGRAA